MTTKQQADLDEIAMELAEKVMDDPGRFGPQHQARIQNAIRAGMDRVISPERPRLIRATAELPDGRTVEVEWPEPVKEALEEGEMCFRSDGDLRPTCIFWIASVGCHKWLLQGRIHLTSEAALQHDRAMIKLNGGEVE